MLLRKNTLQNLFLIIIAFTISFNASINPLAIQISSISFIFFFICCLKNIEFQQVIKENYIDNKVFFIFFLHMWDI